MEILIPNLGDIDEVEVIEICVAPGESVSENDVIIVIESDKASMEIPAPAAGQITAIQVALGDQVKEGDVIALLEGADVITDDASGDDLPSEDLPSDDLPSDDGADPADEPESAAVPQAPTTQVQEVAGEVEVLVPDLGDAGDVVVIEVAIKVGDVLEVNDLLVVLESDKASMEIAAEQAGTVVQVGVEEGQEVVQGTLVATLAVASQAGSNVPPEATETPAATDQTLQPVQTSAAAPGNALTAAAPPVQTEDQTDVQSDDDGAAKVYAGPAVRRLARELGVSLGQITGTGNRNRITKDDVKAFVKKRMSSSAPPSGVGDGAGDALAGGWPGVPVVDYAKFGEIELQPLTRIQQRGADNLHRSWVNLPHVTQHDDVDVTELEEFRRSLKAEGEQKGIKVTPLAFLVKACCNAIVEYPMFNSSLHADGKQLVLKRYINIGMAVDTPDGLVVPVIKAADTKSIWALSAEIAELSEKARTKKLGMDEVQGGTFTISSLGALGGTGFTPIVNAPEVAILGASNMQTRPEWDGSGFQPRKMLPLSLSYDHRVINGADGGRFMLRLKSLLGDIRRLAL